MNNNTITEEIWDLFMDRAVDSSGGPGAKLFEEKTGFTFETFKQKILENQKKANYLEALSKSLEEMSLRL